MLAIQNFQQRLYTRYKQSLSCLPPTYNYLYGNPVQPLVPLNTESREVCIVGGAPPARVGAIGTEYDVPIGDSCGPFSPEPYFDGRRMRRSTALSLLEKIYLAPLGLQREQCWLTYLVRVFLFRDDHLAKYRRLGCSWPEHETYGRFEHLARQGLFWLEEELALVRPRLVITLGFEVAQALQTVPGLPPDEPLLGDQLQDLWLGETVYPVIHLADPEKLSRPAGSELRKIVERQLRNSL